MQDQERSAEGQHFTRLEVLVAGSRFTRKFRISTAKLVEPC